MKKEKRMKPIIFGFAIIAASFVFIGFMTEEVSATTYVVDNQNGPYYTISAALVVAGPNDVINVNYGSGTYTENNPLTIRVPLIIVGQIWNNQIPTVVGSNPNSNVFSITAGYPTQLENLAITGATGTSQSGVYSQVTATSGNEVMIQSCRIYENYNGVTFTSSSAYNVIDDCYVYSNSYNGINFAGSYNKIDDCGSSFTANTGIYDNGNHGVYSSSSSNSMIEDSNIYDNDDRGIDMWGSTSSTIQNVEIWLNEELGLHVSGTLNTIDGMGNRNIKDNNIPGTDSYDVYISGHTNILEGYTITQTSGGVTNRTGVQTYSSDPSKPNIIYNCEISNYDGSGSIGVWIDGGDDVTGSSTEIHDNEVGIKLGDTTASSMVDCDNTAFSSGSENIYDNELGIQVNCDNAIIRETYFYYSLGGAGNDIGISIDNGISDFCDADIDDCLFEKLDVGVQIINSTSNHHSTIDDTEFLGMSSYGVYMEDGYWDEITSCTFTNCFQAGIYLDGASGTSNDYMDISFSTFTNNCTTTTELHTGIYGNGVTYIRIDNSTFDGYKKGIWLDDYSNHDIIDSCDFSDDNNYWANGYWGQNTVNVGIHLKYMSNYNLIDTCDFSNLSYAIGIEGCRNTSIFGDTGSYSTMTDCYVDLFAVYYAIAGQGNIGSTGRIRDYGTDLDVDLEGVTTSHTDFTYKDLEGTNDYTPGLYDSFEEET